MMPGISCESSVKVKVTPWVSDSLQPRVYYTVHGFLQGQNTGVGGTFPSPGDLRT